MLWKLFSAVVARQPDAPAVVMGDQELSYAQLQAAAQSLARRLRESGFRSQDAAALFLPNHPDFVCAVLAIMHEGGTCMPLSIKYLDREVAKYLADAKPRIILTDAKRRDAIEKICSSLPNPPAILLATDLPAASGADACEEVPADAPALWQYSTGSTGQSKSVRRSYGQLHAEIVHYQKALRIQPADRILGAVPLFHAHGFANCLLGALCNGALIELVEAFNPRELQELLSERKITVFPGVPFMFKILAGLKNLHGRTGDFSSLRVCFSAGSRLEPEVSTAFEQVYGQPVRQLYGTTETGSISVHLDEDISATLDSVGRPMSGIEISIRDEEGRDLQTGGTGEIWIKSPAMAPGYFNDPISTAMHFRDGWFSPGDLAGRDAKGRIFIRGRKTLFINVGGNKVDPAEVENFLLSFPKITDAAVLGHSTEYGGEMVKAFVVASEAIEKEQLVAFCRTGLAEFKVPKIVEFRSEIPRSPLGKVLRKYLQEEELATPSRP